MPASAFGGLLGGSAGTAGGVGSPDFEGVVEIGSADLALVAKSALPTPRNNPKRSPKGARTDKINPKTDP